MEGLTLFSTLSLYRAQANRIDGKRRDKRSGPSNYVHTKLVVMITGFLVQNAYKNKLE